MKSLLVFRHAKAEAGNRHRDHERDLVERGAADAGLIGELVASARQVPDRAVASTATRARRTLEIAVAAGGWSTEIRLDEAIYGADVERLLALVRGEDDAAGSLCVVGHEPTLSGLAASLAGGGRIHLPTAGCIRLDLGVTRWRETAPGCGEILWLVVPKLLRR